VPVLDTSTGAMLLSRLNEFAGLKTYWAKNSLYAPYFVISFDIFGNVINFTVFRHIFYLFQTI